MFIEIKENKKIKEKIDVELDYSEVTFSRFINLNNVLDISIFDKKIELITVRSDSFYAYSFDFTDAMGEYQRIKRLIEEKFLVK